MKGSVGFVLIAIGPWLLQSELRGPAKAGHYERQNNAGAPNELRWGGDAEGGSPFVEADPNDPTRVVGFEVEIAGMLAQGLERGRRGSSKSVSRVSMRRPLGATSTSV